MFSKIAVFSALLAVALSLPVEEPVAIVAQHADSSPDGAFEYSYESADGTKVEQHGVPKPVDKDTVIEAVQGSVAYTDPEGGKHELSYTADEGGYQVQGADVPIPPPVPAQIARALEYIAAHPYVEKN